MENRPEYWYRQSAVIPYRQTNSSAEVLLITSRKRGYWILPKGIVEPGSTPAESAQREAFEEAGIEGEISTNSLAVFRDRKWGGICLVEVFPMRVLKILEQWPEDHERSRRWFPAPQAIHAVHKPALKEVLTRFLEQVG